MKWAKWEVVRSNTFFEEPVSSWHLLPCFNEFCDVFNLIFPVLEGQVNVASHFLDHFLSSGRVADDFNFLSLQVLKSVLEVVHLIEVLRLFFLCMEADQSLKHFVCAEGSVFHLDFFFQRRDVLVDSGVVFFHIFVEADNRFFYFFFKIREESFDNDKHLSLSIWDPLLELLLFFLFLDLVFLHINWVVVQFFHYLFQESAQVTYHFVDAE